MTCHGFARKTKALSILDQQAIESIHKATLGILERTGICFENKDALKLFKNNGCKVDFENMSVCMPPGLVEHCLRQAPSSFHVNARNPENSLQIGGNTVYFTTFPGMETVDLPTGKPRKPTKQEYYDAVKILDALPNLHCLWAYAPWWGYENVEPVMGMLESTVAKARFSSKAQKEGCVNGSEIFSKRIGEVIGAEVGMSIAASSPLTYHKDNYDVVKLAAESGCFVQIGSGGIRGSSAPVTLAGSTVSNNAEIIAGIVLTQLVKPGMPILAGDFVLTQNMANGSPAFGDIGLALHGAIFNQYFKRFGIPTHLSSAGPTSSKKIDFQAGYEKGGMALIAALCGYNTIAFHGGLYGELTAHPLQAILDDDIAGMIGRYLEGVEVNHDSIAMDLIESVGPIPGFYLDKSHTRQWYRKEQYIPKSADRLTYPEWLESGKKSALDYAKTRMEELLATHKPLPLTSMQEEQLEEILYEAKQHFKKLGLV